MTASVSEAPAQAYVYAIGATDGPQKIGIAIDPKARIAELQTGSHIGLSINASAPVNRDELRTVESCCHFLLKASRIRGEWFDVTPEQAGQAIEQAISMVRDGWKSEAKPAPLQNPVMPPASLKAWRRSLGLSQEAAAEKLGCGRRSLQLWEAGTNAIPRYIGLACTAVTLGLTEYEA
jgi:DNA-binding transcriptional regulator YiaG